MLTSSNSEIVSIGHVMFQPTTHCRGNCHGCYIKASGIISYTGPVDTSIIDLIYKSRKVFCDQFTISLDTLTKKDIPIKLIEGLQYTIQSPGVLPNPELCITVHNLKTLKIWLSVLELDIKEFLKGIQFLSLSSFSGSTQKEFEKLSKVCKEYGVTLNYNLRAQSKEQLTSQDFLYGCKFADMVYVILDKSSNKVLMQSALIPWIHVYGAVSAIRENVIPDTCIIDSIRFLKDGITCGAGIQKLQVWPNNRASGCPYLLPKKVGKSVDTQYEVFEEMNQIISQEKNPMEAGNCMIPEIISEAQKNGLSLL